MSNVRPFERPPNRGDGSGRRSSARRTPIQRGYGFSSRLFAVLCYAVIMFALSTPNQNSLFSLMYIGILYALVVRYEFHRHRRFQGRQWVIGLVVLILAALNWMGTAIFFGMAGLYWIWMGRTQGKPPYFVRYHALMAVITNALMILAVVLLSLTNGFIHSVFTAAMAGAIWDPVSIAMAFILGEGAWWFILAINAYLAFEAMRDQTPVLPVVSQQVRYWA